MYPCTVVCTSTVSVVESENLHLLIIPGRDLEGTGHVLVQFTALDSTRMYGGTGEDHDSYQDGRFSGDN